MVFTYRFISTLPPFDRVEEVKIEDGEFEMELGFRKRV